MLSLLILFLLLIAFFWSTSRVCFANHIRDWICIVIYCCPAFLQTISKSFGIIHSIPSCHANIKVSIFDQVFAFHLDEAFMQELLF